MPFTWTFHEKLNYYKCLFYFDVQITLKPNNTLNNDTILKHIHSFRMCTRTDKYLKHGASESNCFVLRTLSCTVEKKSRTFGYFWRIFHRLFFQMSHFFPLCPLLRTSGVDFILFFYCKLAQKSLFFFFKMWRLSFKNTQALSVKFILPLFPLPVFCAMTCRNPLSCWEPMCYGSVLSVSCFLWSRGGLCSLFFPLFLPVIVCMWGVSVIFIFSSVCFPALWIPSSTLSLSVFYFFNL